MQLGYRGQLGRMAVVPVMLLLISKSRLTRSALLCNKHHTVKDPEGGEGIGNQWPQTETSFQIKKLELYKIKLIHSL